jgi:hypothetical protein
MSPGLLPKEMTENQTTLATFGLKRAHFKSNKVRNAQLSKTVYLIIMALGSEYAQVILHDFLQDGLRLVSK